MTGFSISPSDLATDFDLENVDLPLEVEDLELDIGGEAQVIVPTSYNDLDDKPRLDGRPIVGDIPELDPTVPDWAKSPTKPEYTAEDVGAVAEKDIEAFTLSDLEIMWDSIE